MFNVLDVRMLDGLCCILQKSISTLDGCVGTDSKDYSLETKKAFCKGLQF